MLKNEYLQAMGVTRWKLRKEYGYYQLKDAQGCYRGGLVVQLAASQSQGERDLLVGIIRALGLQTEEVQSLPAQPLFVLGAIPSGVLNNSVKSTHSLAAMLANPKLKAPVWQDLQNFFELRQR